MRLLPRKRHRRKRMSVTMIFLETGERSVNVDPVLFCFNCTLPTFRPLVDMWIVGMVAAFLIVSKITVYGFSNLFIIIIFKFYNSVIITCSFYLIFKKINEGSAYSIILTPTIAGGGASMLMISKHPKHTMHKYSYKHEIATLQQVAPTSRGFPHWGVPFQKTYLFLIDGTTTLFPHKLYGTVGFHTSFNKCNRHKNRGTPKSSNTVNCYATHRLLVRVRRPVKVPKNLMLSQPLLNISGRRSPSEAPSRCRLCQHPPCTCFCSAVRKP